MIVINTNDGSTTVRLEDAGLTYHSTHGAIQESEHVYIESGLQYYIHNFANTDIHIFEMGFGTGLNCLLTFAATRELPLTISYTSIELHPLSQPIYEALNFCSKEDLQQYKETFLRMHDAEWNRPIQLSPSFSLTKVQSDIRNFIFPGPYDIVYFDAFAPDANPDQWTKEVFSKLYLSLSQTAVLVTYSSKVRVRRALEAAGFWVEKLPGPLGKREIVRAIKQ